MNETKKPPFLRDYQMDAVKRMFNGCILNGGVGSGKSRTGLYYYFTRHGGCIDQDYKPMINPRDLYIITTARKRDTLEWDKELPNFLMSTNPDVNYYNHNIVVDSWNNIGKYIDVKDAFFIFDEQKVIGSGAWVKSFLKITKSNEWILLSATAGDTWMDYIPVFVANGFYKNRSEFLREHVVYARFVKYPKVERYLNANRLIRLRDRILITMDFERPTVSHHEDIFVSYDVQEYRRILKDRWNPYEDKPIKNAAELCYTWRKLVNSDVTRQVKLLELFEKHPKMIIFYNFDYELDILKGLYYGENVDIAEWNGHKHQPVPETDSFVYLVQYNAGAEGWNCIKTDTIVFYSQNYSYKIMEQSAGRIDRLNTPFIDLYYYHLKSKSPIDIGISRTLKTKKKFNENKFVRTIGFENEEGKRMSEREIIAERITRKRRQVLVHSIIYYKLDDSLISDDTWAKWAQELDELQKQYPDIAAECPYADSFKDFDPSSGFNLPLDDPWGIRKAQELIFIRNKERSK